MSNRLIYSPKNAIRCAPLRSFKSNLEAFRFGSWFAASHGNERAAAWCAENGVVVNRAAGEGINTAGGALVPAEFLSVLYSALELRGVIRATAEVVPISRDVASATKVLSALTAYFSGENTTLTQSDAVFGALNFVAKKLATYSIVSSELDEDSLIDIGDLLMTLAAYAFANKEDSCAFNGDGTSTYGGVAGICPTLLDGNHNAGKVVAASGHDTFAEIDTNDLTNLMGKVPAYAVADAGWFVSQMGYATVLCRLAASVGGIVIQETATGRRLPHFMGFPVYLTQVLPQVTTDLSAQVMLLFGNMRRAVSLGDRRQATIGRADQGQTFAEDRVQYRVTERIDIVVEGLGDNTTAGAIVGLVGE
ncbi:phage major capsid protein [Bradyrhizobium sp. AC87j1]|uniref:phage major capsid protein n=1 Tax=Bradyrhizobium sp. AC87j1 TaxID=2055894 RepID=UPI000CEC1022|nr:phage major capsid protein [Bradyrhizobium sp. AC87j1]PPQ20539.1 phage major capsid protein [Bradyrhizobium sp. AC87j1]